MEEQVIAGNKNWSTMVIGSNSDYFVAREWPLSYGRIFSPEEISSGAKVAIVGQVIVDKLRGRVMVGETLRVRGVPFQVIGVLATKGQAQSGRSQDDTVLIPLSTARSRILSGQHETSRQALDLQ